MNLLSPCSFLSKKTKLLEILNSFSGKYRGRVDSVMRQVDRITEDIDHMPVAAFIFRDKDTDIVNFSNNTR